MPAPTAKTGVILGRLRTFCPESRKPASCDVDEAFPAAVNRRAFKEIGLKKRANGHLVASWLEKGVVISNSWRGGRVVECTALEMRHTGNRIGGSNPSLSAPGKPYEA
jgi:hypothetical protein